MNYCMRYSDSGWSIIRHERFETDAHLVPPGFAITVRCPVCGDYQSLGEATDAPADEMRMAERLAREAGRG